MEKEYYIPRKEADKLSWLANFNAKLGNYAAKYAITPGEITDVNNIYNDFLYRLHAAEKVNAWTKQWTAYKNALRDGVPAGATVQAPTAPDLGTAPTAAEPGGFNHIAAIIKKIKVFKTYSAADGQDMQLEGTVAPVDFTSLAPQVSIHAGNAGMPAIT